MNFGGGPFGGGPPPGGPGGLRPPYPGFACDLGGPLSNVDRGKRGNSSILRPPHEFCRKGESDGKGEGFVGVVDTRQDGCSFGIDLGVVLGIEIEGSKRECFRQPGFIWPHVVAEIEWGLGNVKFRAECDWLHGTQLNVVGESVRVNARYEVDRRPFRDVEDPVGVLPTYRVSAGVGYGGIGRNSNPSRLTRLVQIENPGDTKTIEVPPFAVSMTVLPVRSTLVGVDVTAFGQSYIVHDDPSATLTNVGQYTVENRLPDFNGAEFVVVTNKNVTGAAFAFVVFGLAL